MVDRPGVSGQTGLPVSSAALGPTPKDLDAIITAPSGGLYRKPSHAMDEVVPGVFIGEESVFTSSFFVYTLL